MSKFHEIQLGSLVTNLGVSGPSRILGFYLHVETRLVYRDITVTVGHSNCVSAHSDFLHESTIIEFSCFRLKCLSHWAVYVLSDLPDSPWNVLLFRTRLLDVLEHNHDHHFHRVNLSLRLSLKHQDHDHTTPITHLLENSLDRRFFLHFVWHVSYLLIYLICCYDKPRWPYVIATLIIGGSAWAAFILHVKNKEKLASSVFRSILRAVKADPQLREVLGEVIRPQPEWWLNGDPYVSGHVSIHFPFVLRKFKVQLMSLKIYTRSVNYKGILMYHSE